jgi:hypothetical protein
MKSGFVLANRSQIVSKLVKESQNLSIDILGDRGILASR